MRINLLFFVAGVGLLQNQAVLPSLWWVLALPLLFVVSMLIAQKLPREILLKLLFFIMGFLYAACIAQIRLSDSLAAELEGVDIDITGIVAELPQSNDKGQYFAFDVERTHGVPRKIVLSRYFESDGVVLHPGERWRFTVRLRQPHGNSNPYGFDYEASLLERGIRATGYVRQGVLLDRFVMKPSTIVEAVREKLRDKVFAALPGSPYRGVIAALLMGEQKAISQEDWQIFRRTGIIHLMSISGLHVTMIAGFFSLLAYRLWRLNPGWVVVLPARKAAALCGVFSAFCYALLAGYAVPTQRTVYMLAVVAALLWSGRMSSPSTLLIWALFAVTVLDPWAVLSSGFWLSFLAVALIMYVSTDRIRRANWLNAWVSIQWAMTIGLIPILLVFFQQISLVSPIANALAIPVVSFAVVPLTLFGAIVPFDFPIVLAHKIFSIFMRFLICLSNLPDAVWIQHAPPAWAVFTAFLGIFWILLPKGFPARWLGFFGVVPLFLIFPADPQFLRLTVLDVGQGLAVVVQTRHHALLFDSGPAFTPQADSGNRIIYPFLRGVGIMRLDAMILSHEDGDHTGGAISVLDSIPVGWLLSSLPKDNPVFPHAKVGMRCQAGESWVWDDVRFEILGPPSSSYSNPRIRGNVRSCVLRVSSLQGSALIAGDIEKGVERRLVAEVGGRLKSDILVVPHHGGMSASTEEFVQAVSPRHAVFSVGYRNRFNHPRPEVLARYRAVGSRMFRSDRDGAIRFDFDPYGIREESWRREHRRYWYQEK
ncbi:MAG: DNA internalization-related competence protein ComEC/Rec2 [Burkholderiales bacterium]|nr:DNA internalization-related competence protein ComEC/Rec2 [Burkholderiales bacterium]